VVISNKRWPEVARGTGGERWWEVARSGKPRNTWLERREREAR